MIATSLRRCSGRRIGVSGAYVRSMVLEIVEGELILKATEMNVFKAANTVRLVAD